MRRPWQRLHGLARAVLQPGAMRGRARRGELREAAGGARRAAEAALPSNAGAGVPVECSSLRVDEYGVRTNVRATQNTVETYSSASGKKEKNERDGFVRQGGPVGVFWGQFFIHPRNRWRRWVSSAVAGRCLCQCGARMRWPRRDAARPPRVLRRPGGRLAALSCRCCGLHC